MPTQKKSFLKQFLKPEYFFLLFIFVAFVFTRFYNLDKRIIFGWDQEQFSTQIKDIIINHNFTLIGPRVTNDLGFFLAPFLTYFLVPLYLITNLHPFALFYWTIIVNLLFFIVSFIALKRLFSATHAIWFLALWTINFQAHIYDMIPWWPQIIPLGVMITLLLFSYLKEKSDKWYLWIILGIIQGIFCNMHFQFVFIFFFSTLLSFFILRKNKNFLKYFFIYIASFLIMFTPLIIFDLRNDFLNTNLFLNFFIKGTDDSPKNIFSWIPVFANFIQPFSMIRDNVISISFFITITAILLYLFKRSSTFNRSLFLSLFIMTLITAVSFSYYGKRPSEYYFMFFLPVILIGLIEFLQTIKNRAIMYLIFIFFLVVNIQKLKENIQPSYGGLYYKEAVVKYIKEQYSNKKFNISYNGVSVDHGFKYLLEYHDVKQTRNMQDPLIEVSIPARKNSKMFGLYGVTTNF
jgi:hypothetical protein